jgi:hypothetical protein
MTSCTQSKVMSKRRAACLPDKWSIVRSAAPGPSVSVSTSAGSFLWLDPTDSKIGWPTLLTDSDDVLHSKQSNCFAAAYG